MDGGGFAQNQAQNQRAKGVTPLTADLIKRTSGATASAIVTLENGEQKRLGALIKFVGTFKNVVEEVMTHYIISIDDGTSSEPAKCMLKELDVKINK